jgi:DNA-directed RNA polymerase specialized sigma subunit
VKKRKKYVTNTELKLELTKLSETGVHSEKLHLMFYEMAKRIRTKWRQNMYSEDMVSSAYVKCLNVAEKFDLTRPNAFSYFTTVIHNFYLDFMYGEKKQRRIKDKALDIYASEFHNVHGIRLTQYDESAKNKENFIND